MEYTEQLRVVNPGLTSLIMQTSFVNKYNNLIAITIIHQYNRFCLFCGIKEKFEFLKLDTWYSGTLKLNITL